MRKGRKRPMKKLLAILLTLAMTLTLAACGGKDENAPAPTPAPEAVTAAPETALPDETTQEPETQSETASVPGAVEIALPEGESVIEARLLDGVFYIGANDGGDADGYDMNKVYTAGTDGSSPVLLYTHSDHSIDSLTPSRDGSVWLRTYHFDPDTQTTEQTLIHVGADGAVLAAVDTAALGMEYVPEMYPAADGGVVLMCGMDLATLDSAGNTAGSAALTAYLENLIVLPDGQLAALQHTVGLEGTSSTVFVKVDPATGTTTPIPDQSELGLDYAAPLCADGDTLWFTRAGSTVYTLDMNTGAETEQFTLVNAGINAYDMKDCFVKDGVLWSAEAPSGVYPNKQAAGSDTLTLFPARTGEDDRTVLTLATMRAGYELIPLVARFNRVSQDYRVEVRDYTADDPWFDHALEKLNYDIIGGDIPDMYILDSMPRQTLVKQGLLADLSPYLDADADIRPEDYYFNIIDASREDGQLLSLFASFHISTLAALPGQSVTEENNTLENLFSLQASDMSTAVLQCTEGQRENMAASLLVNSPEGMIDLENASCSFDGVKFRALAEMIGAMPVTETDPQQGTITREAPYRLFTAWLTQYGDFQFDNLNGWSAANGGAQPIDQAGSTLVGWPSSGGGVHQVSVRNEFAISSQSAHPDGCWAFLRQLLLDGFQEKLLDSGEGFVLKRSVMDDYADLCVQYDVVTQAEIDAANALLASDRLRVSHSSALDEVYNIAVEELRPYYDGTADLDTVVANLQSRVGLYLSEQS